MVILATAATIIASQAVISGAYSMSNSAMQMGLLPRLAVRRTSETEAGQIYMPTVNLLLMIGVILLVAIFKNEARAAGRLWPGGDRHHVGDHRPDRRRRAQAMEMEPAADGAGGGCRC